MLASVLILGVSTVLFLYWFRYTCELILATRSASDCVMGVSEANGLNWGSVAPVLHQAPADHLPLLRRGLEQDYTRLERMLSRGPAEDADQVAFERSLLRGYFCTCVAAFHVVRFVSDGAARQALHTMARVVEHQANLIGDRSRPAEIQLF